MKKILFIFGTRPEVIKLASVIKEAYSYPEYFAVQICVTAQHREMLDQVLNFFQIRPDYDLNLMKPDQSLSDFTSLALTSLTKMLEEANPDLVVVQGDTTTAFVGALAAFYKKIKIAHIEAGLRSNDKLNPYPEEINRALISKIADYHFAPTQVAKENLIKENIKKNIFVTGNTVIDALLLSLKIIEKEDNKFKKYFYFINFTKKIILFTGHRRENFGKPFLNICLALKEIASKFSDVEIVYPVHLNPNVQKQVKETLKDISNIHLINPLPYPDFIWLLNKSYLVMTDSGGIQEEAPSLGKPVLILREVTERTEGIEAGNAVLLGTNIESIVAKTSELLIDNNQYQAMSKVVNPYGDGKASLRIMDCFKVDNYKGYDLIYNAEKKEQENVTGKIIN